MSSRERRASAHTANSRARSAGRTTASHAGAGGGTAAMPVPAPPIPSRNGSQGSGRGKYESVDSQRSTRKKSSRGSGNGGRGPGRGRNNKNNGKPRKKHHIFLWLLGILATLLALGVAAFAYLYVSTEVPPPEKMAMAAKTTVYYADGTTEMGTFAEQNRDIIDCSALPKYVGNAIVASENRTFYQDKGIDLKGIARALVNNLSGGARQGASTITQQYAERYYLGQTDTYLGKIHEAILALKIAQTQDKDQVLCNYMNTIYLGRGAYGIQAAAKAYYNKDAKDLTLPEAAMLAGIIPAPTAWDPAVSPDMAQKRYVRVINSMKDEGFISAADKKAAQTPPQTVPQQTQPNWYEGPQGYLLQMVRDELINSKTFTKNDLDTGGYKIVTTIDKAKQDTMFDVASPSKGGKGIVPDGMQIGGMSVDPKNGAIQSVYAGDDYLTKQLNNATQAKYEPGSTMKPFALMAAVQAGVSLNTVFNGNSPRTYPNIAAPVKNFGNEQFGYTNLYNATAHSVNTIYMDLQDHLGAKTVAKTAQEAGISPKLVNGDNPFTVLGNDAVHISDIAQAYATIANQGNRPTVHIVASVKDAENKDMYKSPVDAQPVFKSNDAALVTKAMTGTVQYGTATEAKRIGKTVAGKSGTANDGTAGSFAGFTPNTVTVFGIWYPDENGAPREIPNFGRYTGGSDYPVHLFTEYMRRALADTPNEPFPVAKDTGKVGGPDGSWGTGAGRGSSAGSGDVDTTPRRSYGTKPNEGSQDGTNGTPGATNGQAPATVPQQNATPQPTTPNGQSGQGGGTPPDSGQPAPTQ